MCAAQKVLVGTQGDEAKQAAASYLRVAEFGTIIPKGHSRDICRMDFASCVHFPCDYVSRSAGGLSPCARQNARSTSIARSCKRPASFPVVHARHLNKSEALLRLNPKHWLHSNHNCHMRDRHVNIASVANMATPCPANHLHEKLGLLQQF